MKFSTRTTYGLRAMIRLAQSWNQGSLALSAIADSENISQKYLERIFVKLRKVKLVKSAKGARGGYKLAQQPNQINVYNIIKTLENSISPFHCIDDGGKIYCDNKCRCGATMDTSR